jgi:intergrase/recombinase
VSWAGSLARLGHPLDVNNINWNYFREWLKHKYSKQYCATTYSYAKRYCHLLFKGNFNEIDFLTESTKSTVIKAIVVLSKFLGIHQSFKQRLIDYGIKIHRENSFSSFLRIFNVNNNCNDILEWYAKAKDVLRSDEKTFLKFLLFTGLRKEEAIISFNRIIELNNKGLLNEYYDANLNCLLHFKYPKDFIRRTKNCFISFIPQSLINEVANVEPVTYQAIVKRLRRNGLNCRINELRDYFGTFLLQHGILEAEINLCQGRISPSIFIKHYWSPKLSELRDRIFKALKSLEQSISI